VVGKEEAPSLLAVMGVMRAFSAAVEGLQRGQCVWIPGG
jgi:hypothetical protein